MSRANFILHVIVKKKISWESRPDASLTMKGVSRIIIMSWLGQERVVRLVYDYYLHLGVTEK